MSTSVPVPDEDMRGPRKKLQILQAGLKRAGNLTERHRSSGGQTDETKTEMRRTSGGPQKTEPTVRHGGSGVIMWDKVRTSKQQLEG